MKDYKGIYHDFKYTSEYYEFGAHFRYMDLYESLQKLQKEKNDIPLNEGNKINNINNSEENEPTKKRKRYKLKTFNKMNNLRYLAVNTEVNEKENEKNEISKIEEEISKKRKKREKFLTKSLDKVKLPKINIQNSNYEPTNPFELEEGKIDINNYQIKKLSKSINLKKKNIKSKKEEFPKINSLYYNQILQENKDNENMIEETQSRFKDNNAAIKIYNITEEGNAKRENYLRKMSFSILDKISEKNKEKEDVLEILPKHNDIRFDRLKSIFEKEKEIKKINLFLGQKNNYSLNKRNVKNEEMVRNIYNLKRKIYINPN